MKKQTHPAVEPTVYSCGNCGAQIPTASTKHPDAKLDSCSNCHPAYTGKPTKAASEGGRIDTFNKRFRAK